TVGASQAAGPSPCHLVVWPAGPGTGLPGSAADMTGKNMIRETVPWILFVLLFASVVRIFGLAPAEHPKGGATRNQRVTLLPVPGARVTGEAVFSYEATRDLTTISLTLLHLPPESSMHTELRSGSCSARGAVLQRLPTTQADGQGTARLVAYRAGSFVSRRWAVTIQDMPNPSASHQDLVLACGALAT